MLSEIPYPRVEFKMALTGGRSGILEVNQPLYKEF
jgi:hypothetical protein